MKKIETLFDKNYLKLNYLNFKYSLIVLVILAVTIVSLLLIKKDSYYENIIERIEDKYILIAEEKNINEITNNSKLLLDNLVLDYNIEKIEEKNSIFLVYISFNVDVVVEKSTYRINLKRESILEYIVRIVKGEFK